MKQIVKEFGYTYLNFDDITVLSAAKSDPGGFLKRYSKPLFLDEVQIAPELFVAIKQEVDENPVAGQFALTGSAHPLLIPHLSDSLAGRMEILELYPLSQGELLSSKEEFIDTCFQGPLRSQKIDSISREELYNNILKGGYPSVQTKDVEDREAWFNSYITTILQRDIQDLAHIVAIVDFPRLLQLLALRASSLLNVAELSRSSRLPVTSVHRYLSLLETVFLIELQLSWSSNLNKRLTRSPKVFLVDTGILTYLLDIYSEKVVVNSPLVGPIVENFVRNELTKQATWNKEHVKIYHYRTQGGREVDFVLENRSGGLVGIEVKASATIAPQDFTGLLDLKESVGKHFIQGIILYTGQQIVPFGTDCVAVPLQRLWKQ
jgi:predicted AAA+ superfamily ATPase